MDNTLELRLSEMVKERGIKLTALSKMSQIPYSVLQPSLKGVRPLRADEFVRICRACNIRADDFTGERRDA
ncbi:MAG: hypothetical protein EOM14_10750 [Clostridia bacterium]|nr:hypothetical protein [Clostridia bacterium]